VCGIINGSVRGSRCEGGRPSGEATVCVLVASTADRGGQTSRRNPPQRVSGVFMQTAREKGSRRRRKSERAERV
jgi:hypothetical protein